MTALFTGNGFRDPIGDARLIIVALSPDGARSLL